MTFPVFIFFLMLAFLCGAMVSIQRLKFLLRREKSQAVRIGDYITVKVLNDILRRLGER